MADLFALAIVAGMVLFGRSRGALGMLLLAAGLFGGYIAALVLFQPLGAPGRGNPNALWVRGAR